MKILRSNNLTKQLFAVAVFLIGVKQIAVSQMYVFAGAGVDFYQGDVSETAWPPLNTLKLNYGLGVGYDFTDRWGARLRFIKGTLHGSDSYFTEVRVQERGVTFNNSFWDIGLHARYNYLFKRSYKLINYGFFGVEYMNMNVARTVTGTGAAITENAFSNNQFNVPIGIGLGWWLGRHWGLVYEFGYHYAFTDYLDGTSLAGNPKANDSFGVSHILLVYRFKAGGNPGGVFDPSRLNNVDCPKFGY